MKPLAAIGLLVLLASGASSVRAQGWQPTYDQLQVYEGTYEYVDGSTLRIAASPADSILVALIGEARYPLRPTEERHVFLNTTGDRVEFVANEEGKVAGYRLDGEPTQFRHLGTAGPFPAAMWYPRPPGLHYRHAMPAQLEDGITVGSLDATGLDPVRLDAMVEAVIDRTHPEIHGILILHDGRLVLEEYFYEYDRDALHQLRSATKSFVSVLVGIAIDQGLIESVDSEVLPYFEDEYPVFANASDAKRRITVRDLLTNQSGLACDDWDQTSPGGETRMATSPDWVKFVLDLPMVGEPGAEASYCSGGVVVLGRLVEKRADMPLEAFAKEHLFAPLGIDTWRWNFDPDPSSAETFTQLYLRPRDMAKFGLMMANDGHWQGEQIVPEAWVRESTRTHATVGDTAYGYLWWLPYLNVPGGRHDAIAAQGNGGQEIYLWPKLDLVVVLTGGNYNRESPTNRLFIDYILPPEA